MFRLKKQVPVQPPEIFSSTADNTAGVEGVSAPEQGIASLESVLEPGHVSTAGETADRQDEVFIDEVGAASPDGTRMSLKERLTARATVLRDRVANTKANLKKPDTVRIDTSGEITAHAEKADGPESSDTHPVEDDTEAQQPTKNAKFSKAGVKKAHLKKKKEKRKFSARPIRVIIGYLPEVTERDAREYAVGIAEKHFEQAGLAFFDAFKYGNGFAYEVHEGGSGKAYLPEIIEYFEAEGPYTVGERVFTNIRTGSRMVQVQRTRDGLNAIILPEASEEQGTPWLEGTVALLPAVNKRTGFFVAGAVIFVSGFMAMLLTSTFTRFQPYETESPARIEYINPHNLPIEQWDKLQVPANSYVKALRFKDNHWEAPEVVSADTPAGPAVIAPTSAGPAPTAPTPGVASLPPASGTAAPMPAPTVPSATAVKSTK